MKFATDWSKFDISEGPFTVVKGVVPGKYDVRMVDVNRSWQTQIIYEDMEHGAALMTADNLNAGCMRWLASSELGKQARKLLSMVDYDNGEYRIIKYNGEPLFLGDMLVIGELLDTIGDLVGVERDDEEERD